MTELPPTELTSENATSERPKPRRTTAGGRARALLLCLVVVGFSTGAQDCGAFLALIHALNVAAYGRYEGPPQTPPPPPPSGLTETQPIVSFDFDARVGVSVAISDQLVVASGPDGVDGEAIASRDVNSGFGRSCDPPEEIGGVDVDFGASVATVGSTVFVGAPGARATVEQIESGAVFVYDYSAGLRDPAYVGRIDPNPPRVGERFGANLVVDGDTLVIHSEDPLAGGSVHVYELIGETWTHRQTLTPPPATGAFGRGLAILGGRILVGDPGAAAAGAVHTYLKANGTWAPAGTTRSTNPQEGAEFGASVSTSGNTMVVGAPNDDDFRGAAYVFTLSDEGWVLQQRLVRNPASAREGELFGTSVAMSGNRIVVGVPLSAFQGAIDIYDRVGTTWTRDQELFPDAIDNSDMFGAAVAILNGRILVGAPGFSGRSGGAFHYEPVPAKQPLRAGKKQPVVRNAYMGFRPPAGLSGTLTDELELPRTLWAPYRAQIGAGVFDPAMTEGIAGAGFCIGVQTQEAPRLAFEVMGTFTATGLDLQARTEAGPVGTPLSLPAIQRVDVAVERDASDVVLSVRPLGETAFQELARVPVGAQARAFSAFLRSERVPSGAEIGYDDPVIELTGAGSGQPPETTLRDQAFDALTATLGAAAPLELPVADVAAAGPALDRAAAKLQTAVNTADAILQDGVGKRKAKTGPKPAFKQLRKALKKLGVARKKLDKGKPAKAVLKQIEKARKFETKALAALTD